MSIALAVIQPSPAQRCARGGACCRLIPMNQSPASLRSIYQRQYRRRSGAPEEMPWPEVEANFAIPERNPSYEQDDVFAIYSMLEGRCHGKVKMGTTNGIASIVGDDTLRPDIRYIYGPCANLTQNEAGKWGCGIHENKPLMCAEYPWPRWAYRSKKGGVYQSFEMENPAVFRGCGFNLNPLAGLTEGEIKRALRPLSEDEK